MKLFISRCRGQSLLPYLYTDPFVGGVGTSLCSRFRFEQEVLPVTLVTPSEVPRHLQRSWPRVGTLSRCGMTVGTCGLKDPESTWKVEGLCGSGGGLPTRRTLSSEVRGSPSLSVGTHRRFQKRSRHPRTKVEMPETETSTGTDGNNNRRV